MDENQFFLECESTFTVSLPSTRAEMPWRPRDESASVGVERSGEFDLDYDGFATMPLTETVQPIGKIFKRSVLRQHERERTVFECHCHAAWPRVVVMDV
jgi:hypothetical protein